MLFQLYYTDVSVTNVLQIKTAADLSAAVCTFLLFFKLKHSAGVLRPAILRHIFASELGLAVFEIADIITFNQTCINVVAGSVVTQNAFCANRL